MVPKKANGKKYLPDGIILISVFLFMLYVRANLNKEQVFVGEDILFQGNDPWFHIRLIENTLHNFPHRMFFDPMTNFPDGSWVHFGPLFTLMIASVALMIGFGHPDPVTIAMVAVYTPPVLGALTVVPVYLVGRELGGRKTGILAALTLATMTGEFLNRSVIGFTDHHVAESLFSILALWVFMRAIKNGGTANVRYDDIVAHHWGNIKRPILIAAVSGVAFCIYILMWPGAFILLLAILVSIVILSMIDYHQGANSDYLGIVGTGTLLIPAVILLVIVPKVSLGIIQYSILQIYILFIAVMTVLAVTLFSNWLKKQDLSPHYLPLGLGAGGIAGAAVIKLIDPGMYTGAISMLGYLLPSTGNALTIQEARPLLIKSHLDYGFIENAFGYAFYISILALVFLAARSYTQKRRSDVIFLVWSIEVLMLTIGQIRFTYYYAVNAAILVGFLAGLALEMAGFDTQFRNWDTLRKYCSPLSILKKKLRIGHGGVHAVDTVPCSIKTRLRISVRGQGPGKQALVPFHHGRLV